MSVRANFQVPLCWLIVALAAQSGGCRRDYYRRDADQETYQVLSEKLNDPRWELPATQVEPPANSRLHDPADPDFPPLPPDDPVAHVYMHCVDGMDGSPYWHDRGDAVSIENNDWLGYLDRSSDGELILGAETAVELGLLHSREYQLELEQLYLNALTLTLGRFEFDMQWFGRNRTDYVHFGTSGIDDPATIGVDGNETNTLTTNSDLGFRRSLSSGGQLLVNLANRLVWQFTGEGESSAASNIVVELIQPLLRQAGRAVRLETLTQQERAVLYSVRRFARFRKQFYFNLTTGTSGFLSLVLQQQNIRNLEANLASLNQNYLLYVDRLEREEVSEIQVDQVYQSYQQGQLALLRAQVSYRTALDDFKILLGLPPTIAVRMDDSLLEPFQLYDSKVTALQQEIGELQDQLRQDEVPGAEQVRRGFDSLKGFHDRVRGLIAALEREFALWNPKSTESSEPPELNQEQLHYQRFAKQLSGMRAQLPQLSREIAEATQLDEEAGQQAIAALLKLAQREHDLLSDMFIIQNQVRVYQIKLTPVYSGEVTAISAALRNRLDLMNERARVVDAWRRITVAANSLQSDLDVNLRADIATDPEGNNPARFSGKHTSYTVGLSFDGPLNRKRERNEYRASLIAYQRARRGYMALQDQIAASIRDDLRQLETNRLNFAIARQSLIVAARQVEQTREQLLLLEDAADSSGTQDILRALNDLLQAKTDLITTWISYESARIKLEFDLEELQLQDSLQYR